MITSISTKHLTKCIHRVSPTNLDTFLCFSTDLISPDLPNQEDLLSPLFVTAKMLVQHIEPKVSCSVFWISVFWNYFFFCFLDFD